MKEKGEQEDSGEDGKKGNVMQDHPAVLANWEDCLKQFLENKESLWAFPYMEQPITRVIPFLAFIESSLEACCTTPYGKQDFTAEEIATKMFSKLSKFFLCCLL